MKKCIIASVGIAFILAGCWLVPSSMLRKEGALVVSVTDDTVEKMTISPSIEMDAASYNISGIGPDSETFLQNVESSPFVKNNLKVGAWTITVEALNASGDIIAVGTGVASILGRTDYDNRYHGKSNCWGRYFRVHSGMAYGADRGAKR